MLSFMPIRLGRALLAVVLALAIGASTGACAEAEEDGSPAEDGTPLEIAYGDGPDRFGVLHLPALDGDGLAPTVVLVHGGFWSSSFSLDLMDPVAEDLVRRGYAVWNLEFRRMGSGGGWPATGEDVVAGIGHLVELADRHRLDLDAVAVVGHSSGGQLAMWAAERGRAETTVEPALVVALAPVVNLVAAAYAGAGGGRAVQFFLGGEPEEVPDQYRDATPPRDVADPAPELLIVHGDDDAIVRREWTVVGSRHRAALLELDDADHFDLIDPRHPAWQVIVGEIDAALGP